MSSTALSRALSVSMHWVGLVSRGHWACPCNEFDLSQQGTERGHALSWTELSKALIVVMQRAILGLAWYREWFIDSVQAAVESSTGLSRALIVSMQRPILDLAWYQECSPLVSFWRRRENIEVTWRALKCNGELESFGLLWRDFEGFIKSL